MLFRSIEVCDRGIGIPPESQKHLFESFYRASNVSSFPGTGLGLTRSEERRVGKDRRSVDLGGRRIIKKALATLVRSQVRA